MLRKLFLPLSDIVILYASLIVALFLRYGTTGAQGQLDNHLVPFSAIFVVWVLAMYIANLYDRRFLQNRREFFEALGQSTIAAMVVSIIFFYAIPSFGITPKTNLLIFAGVFVVLHSASRYLYNRILEHGTSNKPALIVDAGSSSVELARTIRDNPHMGYSVAGLVHLGQETLDFNGDEFAIIHGMDDFERAVEEGRVETVIIGPSAYATPEVVDRMFESLHRGMTFVDLTTFTEHLTGKVPVNTINRVWFLENFAVGSRRAYGVAKRAVDIIISVIAGAFVLVLFPFVALAIKLNSGGPILFRQQRTGQGGKEFEIIKFRTMYTDAEIHTGAVWAVEGDPRITQVGNFLRKSRVDELPQFWNILRGHMSLVGPRAERPEFDEKLTREIPFYRQRYLVKPGLSGWAQIKYRYGASIQDSMEKLRYDLYYIKNRSLLLDAEIILKTIWISLRQAGR